MLRSPFVGRLTQVALLEDAVSALDTGRGATLHLVGESGIGKTSLLDLVEGRARDCAMLTRRATIDEIDRSRRMSCVLTLLPALDAHTLADPVASALAGLDALGAGPKVLLVDDVHWIDAASCDVLTAIVRRAEDLGTLLVTTARHHPRSAELDRFEAVVDRCGRRLPLDALDKQELDQLVTAMFGASPDDALVRLLTRTSGNPFLVVELLRALDRDGLLVTGAEAVQLATNAEVPPDLGERLARSAFGAAGGDRLLLRAAAVIPRGFSVDELAATMERRFGDVLADVSRLVDAGVFGERDGRLVFRHEIIRHAVLDSTPVPLVRALNRRAATVLGQTCADRARVARCVLAAADRADSADVDELLTLGMALRDDDPFAAADLLAAALASLRDDDPRRVDVVLALGWVLTAAGRLTDACDLLDVLDERDQQRLDVRRLRGNVLSLRGRLGRELTPLPDDFDLDSAFPTVDTDATDLVAELATLELMSGRASRAQRLVQWVQATGVALSTTGQMHVELATAWLHARDGTYESGLEVAERAVALSRGTAIRETSIVAPANVVAVMLDALGRNDEALSTLRAGQDGPGPRWTKPLLQFGAAMTLYRRGEWDDALAEVAAGLASAEEYDVKLGTAWPHALHVMINSARGRHEEARRWLRRAEAEVPASSLGVEWLMHASALDAEAGGDPGRALDVLRATVQTALALGAPAVLLNLSPDTARLAASAGDLETLSIVVDNMATLACKTASPVVHALSAWVCGWRDGDFATVERAGLAAAPCGRHIDYARAHHDAAVIAARAGEVVAARRLASVAFLAYDGLRAQQLHTRLRAELRASGLPLRPRRTAPLPTLGWAALTPTERTIVELVGDGMSNAEIADRQFVSRRTVESHLARVYQKLDLARRAELVVAARDRRSDPIA